MRREIDKKLKRQGVAAMLRHVFIEVIDALARA